MTRTLAHEIKNPLTPMSLSIHRLQKRFELVPESERRRCESLDALPHEIDHLTRMADSFAVRAHARAARGA